MMTRADWLAFSIVGLCILALFACFAAGRGWF